VIKVGYLFDAGENRVAALLEIEIGGKRYLRVAYR
jgi:hypothetical protein